MSGQLQITVSLDVAEIDRLASRIALVVAGQVLGAMQRGAVPTPAAVTHLDERRERAEDVRPARALPSTSRDRGGPITPRQLEILEGWRNRRALEDALFDIAGDVDLADLTKAQASAVLDALTPPQHRRPAAGGRR